MKKISIHVRPGAHDEEVLSVLRQSVGGSVGDWRVIRRSWDARRKPVMAVLTVAYAKPGEVLETEEKPASELPKLKADSPEVIVVGAGPAGLYAALRLVESGIRPVIFERGGQVRDRRRDLVSITRSHRVNPDSNYSFGEGGAGTYSDGKLYTRSKKRGDVQAALRTLVAHGASPEILVEAHPHVGTNKLPGIIESMRKALLEAGAEFHFRHRIENIELDSSGGFQNVVYQDLKSNQIERKKGLAVVLATGHGARDVFRWMHRQGWALEAKPFALGVRVEHPQDLIDSIQYHGEPRGDVLPAASYALVCQADGRGVHSFCMCPGGIIAPCATNQEEIVTNGWSPSKRNNPFANSGIVVQLNPQDWEENGFDGPLGAMDFQAHIERKAWLAAGQTQCAPAQRLNDFLQKRRSESLPATSYVPGVVSVNLWEVLPEFICQALAEGFQTFGRRMKGFLHPDAVLVAPESRTSSPVRIPRDSKSLEHPDISGLYPCGEGAGYAGGILSAALDGTRVACAIVDALVREKNKPADALGGTSAAGSSDGT